MAFFPSSSRPPQEVMIRIYVLTGLVGAAFMILLAQLWSLQISQHKKYSDLSEHNRIRLVRLRSYRGFILDRNYSVLVDERPCYRAVLVPEDLENQTTTLRLLGRIIGLPPETIQKKINSDNPPFKSIVVKRDISFKEVSLLEEYKMDLPGISVDAEPVRSYPHGQLAVHTLGYMGQITLTQLQNPENQRFKSGDYIGQSGLEKVQNLFLAGIDGGKRVEVDARGRELEVMGIKKSRAGNNLILTLDLALQKKAEELLEEKSGCILAQNPQTGEILCLANSPSYNPNKFVLGISSKDWKELISNPQSPLHSRAIQAQYPPGSIVKIILAAAALELGIIDKDTSYNCHGSIRLGNWTYDCWKKKSGGHGPISLQRAIEESCNIYFYNVGEQLGIDNIVHFAALFGLGQKSGIDLKNEKSGLLPTPVWKRRRFGTPWQLGDTISISIGQGYLIVTPIQMLNLISTIANRGTLYRPHIVARRETPEGIVLGKNRPKKIRHIPLSPQTIETVRAGLWGVVNKKDGTGTKAKIKGFGVSGKTGTAQVVRLKEVEGLKEDEIPVKYRDHAWFAAFAPYDQPQIAVTVMIEHGLHGGSTCAPLARQIIQTYLETQGITEPSSPNKPTPPEPDMQSDI
jgi:penicillin-binding protein 2